MLADTEHCDIDRQTLTKFREPHTCVHVGYTYIHACG